MLPPTLDPSDIGNGAATGLGTDTSPLTVESSSKVTGRLSYQVLPPPTLEVALQHLLVAPTPATSPSPIGVSRGTLSSKTLLQLVRHNDVTLFDDQTGKAMSKSAAESALLQDSVDWKLDTLDLQNYVLNPAPDSKLPVPFKANGDFLTTPLTLQDGTYEVKGSLYNHAVLPQISWTSWRPSPTTRPSLCATPSST